MIICQSCNLVIIDFDALECIVCLYFFRFEFTWRRRCFWIYFIIHPIIAVRVMIVMFSIIFSRIREAFSVKKKSYMLCQRRRRQYTALIGNGLEYDSVFGPALEPIFVRNFSVMRPTNNSLPLFGVANPSFLGNAILKGPSSFLCCAIPKGLLSSSYFFIR